MNPVVHWELFAADPSELGRFYAAVFGWVLEPLPDIGYVLIDTCAGDGINGGIATVADGSRRPMFYVSTDDLDASLTLIEHAGGTTTLPPINEVVTFAQFADPEGHIVGLLQRGDESPVSAGHGAAVRHFHLSATDPTSLLAFYQQVFSMIGRVDRGWDDSSRRSTRREGALNLGTSDVRFGGRCAFTTIACPIDIVPKQRPITIDVWGPADGRTQSRIPTHGRTRRAGKFAVHHGRPAPTDAASRPTGTSID